MPNLDTSDDDYADVRKELEENGHNLTSVLVNPRETFFEEIMEYYNIDDKLASTSVSSTLSSSIYLQGVSLDACIKANVKVSSK